MTQTPPPTAIETVSELKPCPFCGGPAISGMTLDNLGYAMCASDKCWGMAGYLETEAEAVAAWNRRSLDTVEPVGYISEKNLAYLRSGQVNGAASVEPVSMRNASIPIYLASRTRNAEVGVRKLPWIEAALVHRFGLIVRVAPSSIGEYRVVKGSQGLFDGFIDSGQVTGSYRTIEAAQEALQADFDTRIRSALAITEPERAGETATFDALIAAYQRGIEWGRENGSTPAEAAKAAYDYADKMTSPLASPPAQEAVTDALREARDAIASLEPYALGGVSMDDPHTGAHVGQYPIRDELLSKIDAALQLGKEGSEPWQAHQKATALTTKIPSRARL
jgi:Lar family restriction alleviation protein